MTQAVSIYHVGVDNNSISKCLERAGSFTCSIFEILESKAYVDSARESFNHQFLDPESNKRST
jgi:hypothetical protein